MDPGFSLPSDAATPKPDRNWIGIQHIRVIFPGLREAVVYGIFFDVRLFFFNRFFSYLAYTIKFTGRQTPV